MTEGKLSKEELREDPVVSAILRLGQYLKTNATGAAIAVGIVVLAVIVVQVVRQAHAKTEQQAAVLLLEGENQYQSGNAAEALRLFQQAMDRHGGSPSGGLALLRTADLRLEAGQAADARSLYEKFLRSGSKDPILRASAIRGLAAVLESMDQHEEAANRFLEAAGIEASPLRAEDLVSAGYAFVAAGKQALATDAFQEVVERFPEHPRVRDAREGLEIARASAGP